jgi:OOP family OmpA-OmpF porin
MPAKAAAPAPAVKYVIEGVHFDTDKATLKPEAMATLDKAAAGLKKQPGVKYEISGYTDTTGAESYNQGLSERRARAVNDYLIGKGVSPGQLTTKGYGEMNPAAANNTSKGRAKNRRVEIWPVK